MHMHQRVMGTLQCEQIDMVSSVSTYDSRTFVIL